MSIEVTLHPETSDKRALQALLSSNNADVSAQACASPHSPTVPYRWRSWLETYCTPVNHRQSPGAATSRTSRAASLTQKPMTPL